MDELTSHNLPHRDQSSVEYAISDSQVLMREVFGPCAAQTVHGEDVAHGSFREIVPRGPNEGLLWEIVESGSLTDTHLFGGLLESIVTSRGLDNETEWLYKRQTHLIAVVDPIGRKPKSLVIPGDTKMIVYGFPNFAPGENRGLTLGVVGALMKKDTSFEFLEHIKRVPDSLETWYQTAFAGLDSDGDTYTGIMRVPASGFVVIESAFLQQHNEHGTFYQVPPDYYSLQRYKFSKPVGVMGKLTEGYVKNLS